jgi:hypothetical protein
MADLTYVTYCGLYCGLCSTRNRTPAQARALQETLRRDGMDRWGGGIPGFHEFWTFLGGLAEPTGVGGCRSGECGAPFCGIRKCAQARGIEVCWQCDEYPCKRVLGLASGYPTLLADGERARDIGWEAWIAEQEARAATGFAYVDVRCYPYEVPDY